MTDHVSTDNAARSPAADGSPGSSKPTASESSVWRILGREQDVMDAYQDCFCKLASLPHRPDLRAGGYACRTATNIAVE